MTTEAAPLVRRSRVDVALESRVRRWVVEDRGDALTAVEDEIVAPDERSDLRLAARVGPGEPRRVAALAGTDAEQERALRRAALASGAELALLLRTGDRRSFVERAAALRETRPDVVLALVDGADADAIVELVEALRAGCADQRPAPRVLLAGDARATLRARDAARPMPVELLPDPRRPDGIATFAHRARELRRGTDPETVLRDEALEELARLLAGGGRDALVVDVSGGSSSLVRGRADGSIVAVHVTPLGMGVAADRTVGRAGLDGVRRWIPWAIDGPTLLERVFNRARWPDAVAADATALALEIALAHEALTHVVAEAAAAGLADALRDAPLALVTGAAAAFARPAHTALVAIDGLASPHPMTLHRDADGALVALAGASARRRGEGPAPRQASAAALAARLAPIAFVVPVQPVRRSRLRVDGRDVADEPLVPGAFFSIAHAGAAEVTVSGTPLRAMGESGPLGIIVDVRGRPLALPPRDAERIPTIVRWFAALDLGAASPV